MQTIESILKKELCQLRAIVDVINKRNKNVPEGHVRIKKKGNKVEYYYKTKDSSRNSFGRYLKKSEHNLAIRLAQKDYDAHVLKNAEKRIKAIEMFLDKYEKTSLKLLYENTNEYRREMVKVPMISDEEYVRIWQKVEYQGKSFKDEGSVIITEKGERVRSKSEKIIADKLYSLGIPYRYEYPLLLQGSVKMYPDFTILKMPEREEVYLEHFGMMDDGDYVDKTMFKLSTYERNGIFIGVNLFITCESGKSTINTRALDKMIKKLFCAE